ncbi:short-chain dehydrogenase [Iodidimonas gelatinilytica]|uniref:Short-chain dehydrogenase n=1 Tax=Iodidimonas gelatinilytica TaxID=1236966 RepID=A0A5A7MVE3_9PROT|nr:NnrS family protein [Iodidimonas gelatinilytica]GEQ98865.1 short-chain dehydrogenase [Iodidimonas gelatinilytica]
MAGTAETMKPAGIPRYRPFDGPVLFRQGFRPFFFGAGLWSLLSLLLWLTVVQGAVSLSLGANPLAWHAHEMIFGFTGAVIAGFLLTAIPNWTGRMPLQGVSLMVLFGTWLLGRLAMGLSALLSPALVAVLDLSFLLLLIAVVVREILAGRNWRNLPMPVALAALFIANLLTHLDLMGLAATGRMGERLGIATILFLIGLVGGRIIPSFTRNWLSKRGEKRLPASLGRFDKVSLFLMLVALIAWVSLPDSQIAGIFLLIAGGMSFLRLGRWQGHLCLSEPLIWSLHLGFFWLPLGLCLLGASIFLPQILPSMAGLHALTAGAVGSMTLAVMTRATLGHTGRTLTADRWTTMLYVLIAVAAAARVGASLAPISYSALLWVSGLLWVAAFGLFSAHYGRMLLFK